MDLALEIDGEVAGAGTAPVEAKAPELGNVIAALVSVGASGFAFWSCGHLKKQKKTGILHEMTKTTISASSGASTRTGTCFGCTGPTGIR